MVDEIEERRYYMGTMIRVTHELPNSSEHGIVSGTDFDRRYMLDSQRRGILDLCYSDGRGTD